MNETEINQLLKASRIYILYLEKKEQELLSKVHELAGEVGKLDKTNAMLVKSNEDLAAKLNYFRACNDNQANLITQLRKDCNAY